MTRQQAIRFRDFLNKLIDILPDDDALDVKDLFTHWNGNGQQYYGPNVDGHPQSRVQYMDRLFKCIQTHLSQSDWTPDVSISLWSEIINEEWPEWVQPIGAGAGYPLGAKVSHNNKHWINIGKDDNEYEPGVWGWEEVE